MPIAPRVTDRLIRRGPYYRHRASAKPVDAITIPVSWIRLWSGRRRQQPARGGKNREWQTPCDVYVPDVCPNGGSSKSCPE